MFRLLLNFPAPGALWKGGDGVGGGNLVSGSSYLTPHSRFRSPSQGSIPRQRRQGLSVFEQCQGFICCFPCLCMMLVVFYSAYHFPFNLPLFPWQSCRLNLPLLTETHLVLFMPLTKLFPIIKHHSALNDHVFLPLMFQP